MKLKHLLQSPCLLLWWNKIWTFKTYQHTKGQWNSLQSSLFTYLLTNFTKKPGTLTEQAPLWTAVQRVIQILKQMNKRMQQCFLPLTAGLNTHSVASKVPYNFFQWMFEIEQSLFSPVHCYLYPDVGPALCSCYIWYWPHPEREKWACRGGRNVSSDDQVSNWNVNPLALGKMPFEASQAVFWLLQ